MFRHVPKSVVLPASRKFAEGSRKGEAEDRFRNKEDGANSHVYMYMYVMLVYFVLCYVMLCFYACSVMYVLYCNRMYCNEM